MFAKVIIKHRRAYFFPTQCSYFTGCKVSVSFVNEKKTKVQVLFNPLDTKGNYSATSNNTKLVHWPLVGGLLHLVQRKGAWAGCGPAQSPPRCTKCNSPPVNGQRTDHSIAV